MFALHADGIPETLQLGFADENALDCAPRQHEPMLVDCEPQPCGDRNGTGRGRDLGPVPIDPFSSEDRPKPPPHMVLVVCTPEWENLS